MSKSQSEIEGALEKFKTHIKQNLFSIKYDRNKNNRFLSEYQLREKKIRELLLSIKAEEFYKLEIGLNPDFLNKELWCFIIEREFHNREDESHCINIYIKWCFVNNNSTVISFHEALYPA